LTGFSPSPIDCGRAVAHPVFEASGATIFAGCKDVLDERIVPPVPVVAGKNRGPFYVSTDSIVRYPFSDSSFVKSVFFIDVQISGNLRKIIFRYITGKRRLLQPTDVTFLLCGL
jgi:hypothetical protein